MACRVLSTTSVTWPHRWPIRFASYSGRLHRVQTAGGWAEGFAASLASSRLRLRFDQQGPVHLDLCVPAQMRWPQPPHSHLR
jgi:hypothetical protein